MMLQVKYINHPPLRGVISGVRVGRVGGWCPELHLQGRIVLPAGQSLPLPCQNKALTRLVVKLS